MTRHATAPGWADATAEQKLDKLRDWVADLYRGAHGAAVAEVIRTLEAHPAEDAKEAADVAFVIGMCRAHPNVLWPNCEAGHVTGSALVIDPGGGRVLLNHHKKFDRWMQFGGHAEDELEPWRVALREAREETGLNDLRFVPAADAPAPFDVDVHAIPARDARPEHYHLDLRYLLATGEPGAAQATDESHAIRWLSFDEALAMPLEANVHRMIRKAMRALGGAGGSGAA